MKLSDCRGCQRPVIPATLWKGEPQSRLAWKEVGGRQGASRGLCRPCWFRMKRAGRLEEFALPDRLTDCLADGCSLAPHARGFCGKHYARLRAHGRVELPSDEERFWPKVQKTETCWLWLAHRRPDGYGSFHFGGRMRGAHRFSHLLLIGPIPEGYEIDHLCRNPPCVNPAHLEAVPPRVNNLRGEGPAALNARKTYCLRGHPFDEANAYHLLTGGRHCRACQSVRRANKQERDAS